MRCYFINKNDSPYFESNIFHGIIQYLQTGVNNARLKQVAKNFLLVVDDIKTMEAMQRFLQRMHDGVIKPMKEKPKA